MLFLCDIDRRPIYLKYTKSFSGVSILLKNTQGKSRKKGPPKVTFHPMNSKPKKNKNKNATKGDFPPSYEFKAKKE